jgi:hypothetical protein
MRGERGQSTTEAMVMLSFLFLLIFTAVHLSMFAVTKYMVNFAAFSAARTVMVRGEDPGGIEIPWVGEIGPGQPVEWRVQVGWPAAYLALQELRWWGRTWRDRPDFPLRVRYRHGRQGLGVTYRVPFGMPILNDVPNGGVRVTSFAPFVIQEGVPEEGDNARR